MYNFHIGNQPASAQLVTSDFLFSNSSHRVRIFLSPTHTKSAARPESVTGKQQQQHRLSDGDSAADLLVLDDEVGVALIIVEDDKDLGLEIIVHAGVVEVAGDAAGLHGRRPPHGVVAHRVPARQHLGQEHEVHALGGTFGEVVGVTGLPGKVAALAEHGGVFAADARVEVVLADPVHHVLRRAVEQVPLVHDPVHPTHLLGHVFLFPVTQNGMGG